MNIGKFKLGMVAVAAMNIGLASQALAAGYEKSILWGGRAAGVAGVGSPYMTGSQALFFNPAGLVAPEVSRDISLNFSPTSSQFKGPINNANEQSSSKQGFSPPFGMTFGWTMNEKWGWGIGAYAGGGAKAEYEGVSFAGYSDTADVKTDLSIIEVAAGAGYRVNEDLKIGAAYRVSMAQAEFSVVNRGLSSSIANVKLSNLKDTNYEGFKLGAQYKVNEKTLIGFTYRSEINLEAEGDLSGRVLFPTGAGVPQNPAPISNSSATVKTTFPMQATLGVQHDFNEAWRFLGEYVWTQYSRIGEVAINGTISVPSLGQTSSASAVQQQWKDQHGVRLAGEYLSMPWPIRFGYVLTTQVTNADWARATFTPPGSAHTFTVGTGQTFKISERPVQFDIAGEYTTVSGDAGTPGSADIRPGTYEATAYAVHAGATYMF